MIPVIPEGPIAKGPRIVLGYVFMVSQPNISVLDVYLSKKRFGTLFIFLATMMWNDLKYILELIFQTGFVPSIFVSVINSLIE